ncbi:type II toxin-antitoxin system VapC family toxin [Chloroflexota bacterium]
MIDAVLDTTVVLHLFRKYPPALDWFNNQQRYGVTSTTWMEVMRGANSKAHQAQTKAILDQFGLLYLTTTDQHWAMQQLEHFQFSHHIGMNDCLIASVAHRLALPLYTPQY